ncbi:MAG TPA: hypothetical protein PL031_07295, partial [Neisseria sp.]|nr:hypothetical protein [Neisseria sp.]
NPSTTHFRFSDALLVRLAPRYRQDMDAAGRIAIGTAVLGGTIISTLLGLLFVPLFFVWVRGWVARRKTV